MSDTPNRDPMRGVDHPARRDGGDFLIVGIGASAGGIKVLREFFTRVPADSGMAYVVILHLSPDYESHLADILQTSTRIPITQVQESVRVEPNHIYVIPQDRSLSIKDGVLNLSRVAGYEERRAPVDIFLRTLGNACDSRAVGIILSGTGANGSMGLKRIKECGGIVIAQDPEEADYADMPRHAIATGLVDYVLPVAEMPARLTSYSNYIKRTPLVSGAAGKTTDSEEVALREIFMHLRVRTGHDFTNYKRATLLRRIARRMNVHELPNIDAYAQFMRDRPEEAVALLRDLLISVTNFFRDREAFEALERKVIPQLLEGKGEDQYVRAWVTGCATGEEAYSIAMLLAELVFDVVGAPTVQIFASDIDERAVAVAREGHYTLNDVADVPPERLRRFFVKDGDGFRVREELREMVLFAHHNLIKDPPFSHLDLVSCRNLLIYLNRAAQSRVMDVAHFALRPGGFLFLGISESTDDASRLFVEFDKQAHIYQSRAVAPRIVFPAPEFAPGLLAEPPRMPRYDEERMLPPPPRLTSFGELHQRLLEQYAPPSVVVSETYEVVHMTERAGRYLHLTGGEPSHNLVQLARTELRLELRTALYQATQQRTSVETRPVSLRVGDRMEVVRVVVRPVLHQEDAARGFMLVLFEPVRERVEGPGAAPAPEGAAATEPIELQLEEELTYVKAQLRLTVEQSEATLEELRASNEELQAMNEELRSTAEELETSKEELQSLNEELTTVNQELKIKIEELSHANNDFVNLINSTQIATVFLDRTLRVRLFTPFARRIFNLLPVDVGRSLNDITHNLAYNNLLHDVERVLDTLQVLEHEVETHDGSTYLMRVSPYRTGDDRIYGAVITFTEISERLRAEASRSWLAAIVQSSNDSILSFSPDAKIASWNPGAERIFGYTAEEVIGQPLFILAPPEFGAEQVRLFEHILSGEQVDQLETVRLRKNGEAFPVTITASPIKDESGRVVGVTSIVQDVTARKLAEERLRASEERLRLIVESVTEYAIITQGTDGRILSWNSGAEHIFGFMAAEAIGQNVRIIFTPEDRERGQSEKEMRTARDEGRAVDERWHIRKDGSHVFMSGVLTPLSHDATLTGYVKIARDLTKQKEAEEALRRAHDELEGRVRNRTVELAEANVSLAAEVCERAAAEERVKNLLHQLVSIQEEERRRIARDLHDHLGQQMTALRLNLEALRERCGSDEELYAQLDSVQELASRLDRDVDFLAWELRPVALDDLGLTVALANFLQEWSKHFGIPAEFHSTGMERSRLTPELETNLYRITQEALNNVYKHAHASRVDVILEQRDHNIVLIVEDDGIGFQPDEELTIAGSGGGMGLLGMRERAAFIGGSVEIESTPGKGTTVFVRLPARFAGEDAPQEGTSV